jgi:large subunit ribosomal protein L35
MDGRCMSTPFAKFCMLISESPGSAQISPAAIPLRCKLSPCHAQVRALFCPTPPMQKTKKSVAKRFKISGTGKLIRRTPGFRHLLAAKSTKSKRRASRDKLVAPGHAEPLHRCLPFGLR